MKAIVIFFFTLLCFPHSAFAQWEQIQNLQGWQGKAFARNADTAFFAVGNGRIYSTYDGGQSLDSVDLNYLGSWFNDIHFPVSSTGYICGGSSFGLVKSPIVKTTDGGLSWDTISANEFGFDLYCTHFISENTGFFGGQGFIVKTTDGGHTFEVDTIPISNNIMDIYFTNEQTGYFLANHDIYKTTDGGDNWNLIYTYSSDLPFPIGLFKLDFVSENVGYGFSIWEGPVKTTDAGNTWTKLEYIKDTSAGDPLQDVDFITENTAYALTTYSIYKTTDGGLSWNEQLTDSSSYFYSLSIADENTGYALSAGKLLKTTNGGVGVGEWEKVKAVIFPNPAQNHFTIKVPSEVEVRRVEIRDMSGKKVQEISDVHRDRPIVPEGLKAGIYMILIDTDQGVLSERICIE